MWVGVWCSGCVLVSGLEVPVQAPPFSVLFSICLPPVHPALIGDLAFAGVQIQGVFSSSHETAMVQVGLRCPHHLL